MVEALFKFLSFSPGVFWLILVFTPRSRLAMRAFDVFLFLLSAIFAALTLPKTLELLPVIAAPTFGAVQAFLSSDLGTLGAWNHMILGDLWIGRWVVLDALKHGVPAFIRVPITVVILFFGPLGLFFYLAYRWAWLRRLALVES